MALLIYYPTKQIALMREYRGSIYVEQYLEQVLPNLVKLLQYMGSKYTRSKVRKLLPSQFSYIIEELVAEIERSAYKEQYFQVMIDKIVQLDQLENLVEALSKVIQSLAVDHLHVVGDIFDRGPEPDLILDRLASLRSVDVQ